MAKKKIKKKVLDKYMDRIMKIVDEINSGQRPRRGIATAGLKVDKSHYKLGGNA